MANAKSLVMRSLKRKAGMHGMVYVMTPDAKVMDKILAAAQQATKNMIAHQISAEAEGQKEAPMAIGSTSSGASPDEYFISSFFLDCWHALSPDCVATCWKMPPLDTSRNTSTSEVPQITTWRRRAASQAESQAKSQSGESAQNLHSLPPFPWFVHFLGPKPWRRPSDSLQGENCRSLWLSYAQQLCAAQPAVLAAFRGSYYFSLLSSSSSST